MSVLKLAIAAALLLPLAALLGIAATYLYWVHVEHRLTEITPGRLYISAAMPPERTAALAQRLGVQTVLDFRLPHEGDIAAEREALARVGIRHLHLPADQNPSPVQVDRFIETLGNNLLDGGRVLMHCHHGEGRAVFFAGVYRVAFEHWSGEDAFRASQRLPRSLSALNQIFPGLGRMSERNPKSRMLREFSPSAFGGAVRQTALAD